MKAKLQLLSEGASIRHFAIRIHIEEGDQYRLGKVGFRSSDPDVPLAFPVRQLREMLPMNDGDVFAASKIREGLDNMKKAYSAQGYIDFVATPVTDIDDSKQTISITFEFDQQKQYRIGTVEVFGPDRQAEEFLKSRLRPGEIFNQQNFATLLKENGLVVPEHFSPEDVVMVRNVKSGTINIRLNFQSCPETPD